MDWSDKVTVITGAASGIGRALAEELAEQGSRLGLIDRDRDGLRTVREQVPGDHLTVHTDVSDSGDVSEAFEDIDSTLGTPDVVVANAGLGYTTPADDFERKAFKQLMSVNYDGVVNTVTEGLPRMLESDGGELVITSSVLAFMPMKGGAGYCGSKSAVLRLAESIRLDLEADPISVTTLHPGWVKTPMTEKYPDFVRFFEMSPEKAAGKIRSGIESDKNRIIFPWPMKLLVNLTEMVPNFINDFIRERVPMPEKV